MTDLAVVSGGRDEARSALSDALIRTAGGDRAAFAELYRAVAPKLMGVILRICRERGVAEDVLQEVFLSVWNRAAQYDPARASPMSWLVAISRNRAIDRIRAQASRPSAAPIEAAEQVVDRDTSAEARLVEASEAWRLQACLDELDARHAAALRAAFFEGLTYEALAAREGTPTGTMKSWIRRSLIRLRGCLER